MAADGNDHIGASRQVLASLLDAHRTSILASCEQRLHETGSPLVGDHRAMSQLRAHAQQIIDDVVASVRAEQPGAIEDASLLARQIGRTRAADGVHPRESLLAASALFESVVTALSNHLGDENVRIFAAAVLALNDSLTRRIREAATTYSGYLLNKIHEAHVAERRRIARELHDRVGSVANLAHLQLELWTIYWETEPAKAADRLTVARHAVREAMDNVRAVTSELQLQDPPCSLETSLHSYLDSADVGEVKVDVRINGDETWAPPPVRSETFLILREALRNAFAHGRPTTILVGVDIAPHELRGAVDDDGSGFDTRRPRGGACVGLSAMQERAALLGGTVNVSSRPSRGTHVEMLVPLPGHRHDLV